MMPGGNNYLPMYKVLSTTPFAKVDKIDNSTGTITVTYTNAPNNRSVVIVRPLELPDGDYYFSGNGGNEYTKAIVALISKETGTTIHAYRMNNIFHMNNSLYTCEVAIQSNATDDDTVTTTSEFHNLMINPGTEPLPFEPFYPLCVYDRTQADVDRVLELNQKYLARTITEEEKAEWAGELKGALNISDINRIEENTALLASLLAVPIRTKMWKYNDIPRASDYLRIRNNVQAVRDAWAALSDTPETPIQPLITFQKWNDIERILHDVNYVYERTMNSYYYCDTEIYAGEGAGIL